MEIAEAVAAALNGAGLSPAFTAEVALVPTLNVETIGDTLQVLVAARTIESEKASRASRFFTYPIDIGVQKKVSASGRDAEAKTLLTLVEEMDNWLADHALAGLDAPWVRSSRPAMYVPDHLEKMHVFTGVFTAEYQTQR